MARRSRHSYKRNPSLRNFGGSLTRTAKTAAVGAVGALGLDLAYGYTKSYLPAGIAGNQYGALAIKAVGAVLVGMIGNTVMRGKGSELATGAMTVIFHDTLKQLAADNFPTLPLSEYLSYAQESGNIVGTLNGLPDISSLGAGSSFSTDTLGEYLS